MLLRMLERGFGLIEMNCTVRFMVMMDVCLVGHLVRHRRFRRWQRRSALHGSAIQGQAEQPQEEDKSMHGITRLDFGKL